MSMCLVMYTTGSFVSVQLTQHTATPCFSVIVRGVSFRRFGWFMNEWSRTHLHFIRNTIAILEGQGN